MRKHTLEIRHNEVFEQEFLYLDLKNGQDFSVNIEEFNVVWEVKETASSTELFIGSTDYSSANSILKNGFISINMNSLQTGKLDTAVKTAVWTLYIVNPTTEDKYYLCDGKIKFIPWVFHEGM